MVNFYEILGISTNANSMDIERAVRLARQGGDVEEAVLSQARNYLLDPKMRKLYDKKMNIKATPYIRGGSGLQSGIPFWIPVLVIASIMLLSIAGMYFANKDAAEKRRQTEKIQYNKQIEAKERVLSGDENNTSRVNEIPNWYGTRIGDLPSPQYMVSSKHMTPTSSPYKELKLVLVLPKDQQSQLLLLADQPVNCEGECRVQLQFSAYEQFSLSARANDRYYIASISQSTVDAFKQTSQVTVTFPDVDKTQFVFAYPALKEQ